MAGGGGLPLPVFQNKWHVIFCPITHHHTFLSLELDIHLHQQLHVC